MGLLPEEASLWVAEEEEVQRQSREQISPKNVPQGRMMAFGLLQGTPTPSARTLPANTAPVSGFSCRTKPQAANLQIWSQRPIIRCKFAVQVPLSRETTTLLHFLLLPPKYPARLDLLFYCRSKLKILPSYRPVCKPISTESYTSPHQWISFLENKKLLSISRS